MLPSRVARLVGNFFGPFAVLTALSFVAAPLANAQAAHVTIDGAVTLVVSAQEPGPVHRATQDLVGDFTRVFGKAPKVVDNLDAAGPVAIVIAGGSRLPAGVDCATAQDAEAFAFSIAGAGVGPTHRRVVCLTGADMRGTIYAIYEFSQRYLGVDPMYLWTDKMPARRVSITLPADFAHVFPKPAFRYRGFFINDEDLLTGWIRPKKGDQTGIALEVWDQVFETILRLKGNMVVPGTWTFPDDAPVHAATERGLIVNQHHAIPLGLNAARWPNNVPYNYSTHPEILERAWTNAVAEYKPDEEILWSVGLRGLSDSSYASLDPSVRDNDPLLGKRISDAIADQMKIVRAKYPNAQFVTDLWQEGARLTKEGYLKIPPEVSMVWADTGYGDMQDGGAVGAGQGAYFHTAMMNGQANQLTELVPVGTIQSELGRYIKAGATSYLLVNTSDLRPVAMTTRALMEVAWGGVPTEATDADGAYYRRWATEEFGAKSAEELAKVYSEYFAAPSERAAFNMPRLSSAGNAVPATTVNYSKVMRMNGDNHYHSEIRRLLEDDLSVHQVIAIPSQSPKWTLPRLMPTFPEQMQSTMLDRDIKECEEAQPRWDAVWKHAVAAEALVDPSRKAYYQAEMLNMITINRESNRALLDVARAMKESAAEPLKAQADAASALQALDAVQLSMKAAEYGKWKNFYRGDWLTGVYRSRELVQDYANHLKDPLAKLPAPVSWSGWEAYFHIMEYEGDRSVDVH